MSFIPARVSPTITQILAWYARSITWRKLHRVWLKKAYEPRDKRSTLYLLNHHTWYDGLIPLLLNHFIQKQDGRAMMDLRQMQRYPFFRWIGAFSVDAGDPAHIRNSLHYAARWLKQSGNALYLFPQGRTEPFTTHPSIQRGTLWLLEQSPIIDLVPVGVYLHAQWHNRPELQISINPPLELNQEASRQEKVDCIEEALQKILERMVEESMDPALHYQKWI